jgi:anaerobic selenocysteine-containing dehydrogenase/Fe-S-cluster-containing dehydrogenase component
MTKYGMLIDLTRCTGCYTCVVSCKQYFGTRPGVDYNQGGFVEWGRYPNARRRYLSTMCNHCDNPPCLETCRFGATYKSPQGPVLTDREKCTGCGACVTACPYGQRFLIRDDDAYFDYPLPTEELSAVRIGKAEKCTLCQDRLELGLEPVCVVQCPGRSRIFGDLDDPESEINYYIKLYGALRIEGTSLYYVVPEDFDVSWLPPGRNDAGELIPTTLDFALPKAETGTPEYREYMDGLIAARDFVRQNDDRKPVLGGETGEYRYSYCSMCNHMPRCGVKIAVRDGKAYHIDRRESYGNELICAMGAASLQDIYAPDRLLYPQRRTNPKGEPSQWEHISWDEALGEIAANLNRIKAEYGADKVLFMTGDPKEPRAALQRLAYRFGTPNYGTESSTCYTAAELATRLVFGLYTRGVIPLTAGALPDVNDTKAALIWASNPGVSATFLYDKMMTVREYTDIPYIVIDPRVTSTSQNLADVHLQIRPGTDGALALYFANELIANDAYDRDFVENWTHGFEEYRELASEYTAEKTAEICDVSIELLKKAADILVRAGSPITIKLSGAFPQHTNGVDNFRAKQLLVALTGSLDVEGGHLIPNEPLGFDSYGGSYDFTGAHSLLPELAAKRVDREYFPVWADTDWDGSLQVNMLPEYVRDGKVRALFALGLNAIMWPQSREYQQALGDLEFLAVADFRENPWTHDYADIILPAAMAFERSAPFAVAGRKVFLREPALEPRGEARPDFRICFDLGVALGLDDDGDFFGGGAASEEVALREIWESSLPDSEVSFDDLRAASPNGIVIPLKKGVKYRKWELGLLREDGQPGFSTPSGKVEFASEVLREHDFEPLPRYREPSVSPVSTPEYYEEFPLIFNSGSRLPFYCHSKERKLPWLSRFMPDPVLYMEIGDAETRGLINGQKVRITSPSNREGIVAMLQATNVLRPGMIDIHHGWPQANANALVPRDFDPISGFPAYKEGLCQVVAE